MKLAININPKQLFRSKKKSWSVSRSDPSSFSSGSSSSESLESSSTDHRRHKSDPGKATPTSVLPSNSPGTSEISAHWSELSADIYFELAQAFKMIDKDGDGRITRKELEAVLSRVGAEPPSEEELMMMLSEVDRDGDGCISLEEFSAISSAFGPPSCDSELRDAFDFFDTDHDGRITAEELHAGLASIGAQSNTKVPNPTQSEKQKMDFRLMGLDTPIFHTLQQVVDAAAGADDEKSINAPSRTYVRDAKAMAATPADVKEHPNAYSFIIDMPGIKSGDIKVQVEDGNVLVISGERKREEEEKVGATAAKYVRMERRVGKFMRKFVLPENANTDAISAVCQDGVLTVTVQKLPPPEPKKPKTIEVKIA